MGRKGKGDKGIQASSTGSRKHGGKELRGEVGRGSLPIESFCMSDSCSEFLSIEAK